MKWTEYMTRDLRVALRVIRKNMVVSAIAVGTIALGVGANTAVFSLLFTTIMQPLPYRDHQQIVILELVSQKFDSRIDTTDGQRYRFWRDHQSIFDKMVAFSRPMPVTMENATQADRILVRKVTADFFSLLDVKPVAGRFFEPADTKPGSIPVAILSYACWRRSFGGTSQVLGRTVTFGNGRYTIVGIAPAPIIAPLAADVWLPLVVETDEQARGTNYHVIARLKPGVSLAEARSVASALGTEFQQTFGIRIFPDETLDLSSYEEALGRDDRSSLFVLTGASALVLLIACANVASLMLARTSARQKEMAIRRAVGASRWHICRQLMTESLLIALLGGGLGLILAQLLVKTILFFHDLGLPRLDQNVLDLHVLLFAFAASILTGFLFGVSPVLRLLRINVQGTLQESGNQSSETRGAHNARGGLVVIEFAVSLILLVATGLLLRTVIRLHLVDTGFDPYRVLTAQMMLDGPRYLKAGQVAQYAEQVVEQIKTIPEVTGAAMTNYLPLGTGLTGVNIPLQSIVGQPKAGEFIGNIQWFGVTPGFFATMKIPVFSGRDFNISDTAASPPAVVVNQAFVRTFLHAKEPLGQQIQIGWSALGPKYSDVLRQIIGVVGDIREKSLLQNSAPAVFVPLAQIGDDVSQHVNQLVSMKLVVRTTPPPSALTRQVASQLRTVDPLVPSFHIQPMTEVLDESIQQQRFMVLLIGGFGVLAGVLAAIGIYGVMSYSVVRRTKEIGIRSALGAQPGDLLVLVLREGLSYAAFGIAVGAVGSWAATRTLKSFLFGVTVHDPLSFIAVAVILLCVALLACAIPAWRATRVQPGQTLRHS